MGKPALLQEYALQLRRAAETTWEAERRRIFPILVDHCEQVATKIETDAAAVKQLTSIAVVEPSA